MILAPMHWNEEAAEILAGALSKTAGPSVDEIRAEVEAGDLILWGIFRPDLEGELFVCICTRWLKGGRLWIEWAGGGDPESPVYGAGLAALERVAEQLDAPAIGAKAVRPGAAVQLVNAGYRWKAGEFWKALDGREI